VISVDAHGGAMRHLRAAAVAGSVAAVVAAISLIPADMTSSTRYARSRAMSEPATLDDPGDAVLDIYEKYNRIRKNRQNTRDLLLPYEQGFTSYPYATYPAVSADGRLAFSLEETGDYIKLSGWNATLRDIDTGSVIWERILLEASENECNEDDQACIELLNIRRQGINAYLSKYRWINPDVCNLVWYEQSSENDLYVKVDSDVLPHSWCARVELPQRCVWPELTVTFDPQNDTFGPPRLRAVAANGTVLVDKVFPRCMKRMAPCNKWERPYLTDLGFDRETRVMFATVKSCVTGCGGYEPDVIHLFRLPKL
jgi:hypothetical protein